LGVDRKADVKEIKKAFRKQSLECHPDKFPGDAAKEARFKQISEAYQTLSDTSARRDYDSKLGGTNPRSGTPSQQGRYAAYSNNPNNFRQYRNPNQNPFERSEKWNEVFDELNKQRYNNFSKRRPDFSDFMNGRRGTDWDDYRRTFKEDAHPFNETKRQSNRFYESQRFQSYEKYANARTRYENTKQEDARRQSIFMLKILSVLMLLSIIFGARKNQEVQSQEAQYYLNQSALVAAQRKIYEERMRQELAERQAQRASSNTESIPVSSGFERRSSEDDK